MGAILFDFKKAMAARHQEFNNAELAELEKLDRYGQRLRIMNPMRVVRGEDELTAAGRAAKAAYSDHISDRPSDLPDNQAIKKQDNKPMACFSFTSSPHFNAFGVSKRAGRDGRMHYLLHEGPFKEPRRYNALWLLVQHVREKIYKRQDAYRQELYADMAPV